MRALVTGGAGFIGSHLAELLLRRGHSVTVLDDLSTGRLDNLRPFLKERRFSLRRTDCTDPRALRRSFGRPDWVFHLAARADIVPSVQRPSEYFRANVDGTLAVLEAAREARVRRFVYAASSSCYGIPDAFPTPETAPVRPQYPYALTKWLGEQTVLHWGRVYGLGTVALRLFNVYGPRSRTTGAYGAVFGVFLAQKLKGLPLTVVGDGRQTRDFVHVTDVARAFLLAAQSGVSGEVFNVGTGEPQSVRRLVGLIGGPSVRIPKRPGEPDRTHADPRRVRRALGWRPRVRFDDGVRDLLSRIEHWRDAPVWTPGSIRKATRDWFKYLG
jgi:UDP-glucose 4-epimerase